jgi:hypothetical protein
VKLYVVATSQKEALECLDFDVELGHKTKREAEEHLAEVKAPPTDPFYAAQYKIYEVTV